MATATERIPVLVTAEEKEHIAKMAKSAGLSMGEFLRRADLTGFIGPIQSRDLWLRLLN